MHIAVDGGTWRARRGYGRFLRELLRAIANRPAKHTYTLLLDWPAPPDLPVPPGIRIVVAGTGEAVASAARAEGRRGLADIARMSLAAARIPYDLFFFPAVYSYFPLLRRAPAVLGVHDAIADRNPRFSFAGPREHRFWRWKNRLAFAQADRFLTVSAYARQCIVAAYEIAPEDIRVVPEAASAAFRPTVPSRNFPYFLAVGGLSPNKNLARLIEAFAATRAHTAGVRLLLAGDHQNDAFLTHVAELRAAIALRGLEGKVELTGFVPDEDLADLYSGAIALTMPSLDEGFGLPAIEALACGTPVIASRGNSLEEVVGPAGILVDPASVREIATAMDRVHADADGRRRLADEALRRAALFSWEECARRVEAVFEEFA